jgi:hypothetical protein
MSAHESWAVMSSVSLFMETDSRLRLASRKKVIMHIGLETSAGQVNTFIFAY